MIATISPSHLADLRRRGDSVTLIDVRTPAEFGEVHVDGARNLPLDRLDPKQLSAEVIEGTPIYFVCKSGGRSQKACEKLIAAGISNVVSVEGGTAACEAAGVPVVRGRKVMSLERQVRICAGAIVALGAALGAFAPAPWNMVGIGLAGFIGAGLVFAGITDTCGMAMVIARMPWNQAGGTGARCTTALVAAIALSVAAPAMAAEHTKDSLDTVKAAVAAKQAVLIDVREPEEWEQGHVAGAGLLPLSELENGLPPAELAKILPRDKPIYLHCFAGGRCLDAADILARQGFDVRPLKPGYPALVKAGFPTAKGR